MTNCYFYYSFCGLFFRLRGDDLQKKQFRIIAEQKKKSQKIFCLFFKYFQYITLHRIQTFVMKEYPKIVVFHQQIFFQKFPQNIFQSFPLYLKLKFSHIFSVKLLRILLQNIKAHLYPPLKKNAIHLRHGVSKTY